MTRNAWWVRRSWGIAVGALVTAVVTLAHAAGAFRTLELATLDFCFRHVNRISDDDRIVLIDIGDPALERVGRWPWPRRQFADMITVLDEAGAAVIAVDIVWAEPQEKRLDHPLLSAHSDVDPPQVVYGNVTLDDAIRDDDELVAAVRQAGNVYLAMFGPLGAPGQPAAPSADPAFRAISNALRKDYIWTTPRLADALALPAADVERYLARAKRFAARELARQFLDEHPEWLEQKPDAAFNAFRRHVMPEQQRDSRSSDQQDLLRGFRTDLAARFSLEGRPVTPDALKNRIPHAWNETYPLDKLAGAARGVAFVTFEPDRLDGVLRHIPLVMDARGQLVPHLGFAVACDQLGIDLAATTCDDGSLSFTGKETSTQWNAPLNLDGKTLVNWHVDRDDPRWLRSYHHVPATRVMEVAANRRAMQDNLDYHGWIVTEAVEMRFGPDQRTFGEYVDLIRQRNTAHRHREPVEDAVHAEIRSIEDATHAWLEWMHREIDGLEPENDEEAGQFTRIRLLHEHLAAGKLRGQIEEINGRLRDRNEQLLAELRERIDGKICLVGYTATAVADTVNTPVFDDMPGVMAHANLLNSVLQNRFPRMSSIVPGAMLILVTGLAITLVTSHRGPRMSLIAMIVLLGLVIGPVTTLLMSAAAYYLYGAVAAVLGVFITWAFVTLYRQVIEQRQRRQIARSLARQTSPAIAARIARGASDADLVPQPANVTCYFSDLQGFTTLSESVGPEGTQEVLNLYLAAMSDVLLARRGSSKFMGDGIFAYFNAPIWPCDDHVAAACEGALDCLSALDTLKSAQADGKFGHEFASLVMRAGIHTGPAFAGSYGSGERAEYTCIGDTVNVAARLESANKAFGTRIMVSEAVLDDVDDQYEVRCLGRLQVKGKTTALMVYELLGRVGTVGPDDLKYAEAFAEAVFLFGARRWDEAQHALDRAAKLRDDDPAIEVYEAEIRRLRDDPPPPEWNQAIVLTGK